MSFNFPKCHQGVNIYAHHNCTDTTTLEVTENMTSSAQKSADNTTERCPVDDKILSSRLKQMNKEEEFFHWILNAMTLCTYHQIMETLVYQRVHVLQENTRNLIWIPTKCSLCVNLIWVILLTVRAIRNKEMLRYI